MIDAILTNIQVSARNTRSFLVTNMYHICRIDGLIIIITMGNLVGMWTQDIPADPCPELPYSNRYLNRPE
jgi:hypothetical protein